MPTMVTLQANDGERFEVDIEVAKQFKTLQDMFETVQVVSIEDEGPIPIPFVSGNILRLMIRWANYHHRLPDNEIVDGIVRVLVDMWYNHFFEGIDEEDDRADLLVASVFLRASPLVAHFCEWNLKRLAEEDPYEAWARHILADH